MTTPTNKYSLVIKDFAKFSRDNFIFKTVKICGTCERYHTSTSRAEAKKQEGRGGGYMFNCSCGSTLLVRFEVIGNE